MVSATRVTSARTPPSRSGVPRVPCRYLLATMLVAVIAQSLGTSTSFCSKMTPPLVNRRRKVKPGAVLVADAVVLAGIALAAGFSAGTPVVLTSAMFVLYLVTDVVIVCTVPLAPFGRVIL